MKAVVSAITVAWSPAGRQVQGRVPVDAVRWLSGPLWPTARRSGQHPGEHSWTGIRAPTASTRHRG